MTLPPAHDRTSLSSFGGEGWGEEAALSESHCRPGLQTRRCPSPQPSPRARLAGRGRNLWWQCQDAPFTNKTSRNLLHPNLAGGTLLRLFSWKPNVNMKKTWALVIITGLAATQAVHAGEISGTITLHGTPPAELEIKQIKDDPNCGKLHTEAVKTRFYVVGANKGLADVFVTLKGISGKSTGAPLPQLLLNFEFAPELAQGLRELQSRGPMLRAGKRLTPDPNFRMWTDDFSNMWSILR